MFNKLKKKVKNKKKCKKVKIKMNKASKRVMAVVLLLIGFLTLLFLIGAFFPEFASWYLINIRNPIYGVLFDIGQYVPFLSSRIIFIFMIIIFILTIVIGIIENTKKLTYFKKEKYANNILIIIFVLLGIGNLVSFTDYITLNSLKMNQDSENFDKSYSKEDLINLNRKLADKIMVMSSEFERDNNRIKYDDDIVDVAADNLLGISDEYEFLKGRYPNRVSDFYDYERATNYDGMVGYTMLYSIFIDKDLDKLSQLSTVTHELCHAKGLVRESETEFCAYVAGAESDDELSQYVSYLNGFMRSLSVLYMVDRDIANDIEEPIQNMCLNNEYEEICGLYLKEINNYINDSDELWLGGYRLRNYFNHSEKFMELLTKLDNNFDVKFLINDKKVDLDTINAEINNGSKNTLKIKISIDEKKFEKVSKILKNNKKYFYGMFQMNSEIEEDDVKTGNEALDFYLAPFDEKYDSFMYFTDDYMDEYDYDRLTRLLLEYYY